MFEPKTGLPPRARGRLSEVSVAIRDMPAGTYIEVTTAAQALQAKAAVNNWQLIKKGKWSIQSMPDMTIRVWRHS